MMVITFWKMDALSVSYCVVKAVVNVYWVFVMIVFRDTNLIIKYVLVFVVMELL